MKLGRARARQVIASGCRGGAGWWGQLSQKTAAHHKHYDATNINTSIINLLL